MAVPTDLTLTYDGIDAAEHVSEVLGNEGQRAAVRVASEEYGWNELGSGIARIGFDPREAERRDDVAAFEISNDYVQYVEGGDEAVIKIGSPRSGQNAEAIANWKRIAGITPSNDPYFRLEEWVAPITDWDDERARCLVMPKGDPAMGSGPDTERSIKQETGFHVGDLHADNVAVFDGEAHARVIDLGSSISFVGTTDEGAWDDFMDVMRNYGARDVHRMRRRRNDWSIYFRHPTRLPGEPYENEDSEAHFSNGGHLVELELYLPYVPTRVAGFTEIENLLDEAADFEGVPGRVSVEAFGTERGNVPLLTMSGDPDTGPTLSEMSDFFSKFFDQYDQVFSPAFEDAGMGGVFAEESPSDLSPEQAQLAGTALRERMQEFYEERQERRQRRENRERLREMAESDSA